MNNKNLWVSFLAIATVLFLATTVSAAQITSDYTVEVNGQNAYWYTVSVVENENINVEVSFTALVNDTDVTVEVELTGNKGDVDAETAFFDVEAGNRYTKTLVLEVPRGLNDEVSDSLKLDVKISGKDHESELYDIALRVQRESYSIQIKSVSTGTMKAGQMVPVDVVVKNVGYNDLDDLYIVVKIPALNLQRSAYFGDLVAIEDSNDDDDTDTVSGRLFLEVPYSAKAGVYALEVTASNGDTTTSAVREVSISNEFSGGNIVVSGDSLLIVNPTNEVLVYRLVPEPSADLSVSLTQNVIAVPAGSSRTVDVTATGSSTGTYNYKINVFSLNGELLYVVNMTKSVDSGSSSPIVALTVILAIIFVVLLVVLIVLMGKKPEKSEEFGESYY
ncbi:hypothetical protein A3K62_01285 [Candidatus Pacearchaeota archaeon RBG_16_35_8]|nr:MAG: hypothetical protein A3K62_01285 [Candidatus Pacearchaeota archaeon RBG_16_35_8]